MKISKILCLLMVFVSAWSAVNARSVNKFEALKNKNCEHFLLGNGEYVLVCTGEAKSSKLKSRINPRGRKNSIQEVVDFIQGPKLAKVNTRANGTCPIVTETVHTDTYTWTDSSEDWNCDYGMSMDTGEAELVDPEEASSGPDYGDNYDPNPGYEDPVDVVGDPYDDDYGDVT